MFERGVKMECVNNKPKISIVMAGYKTNINLVKKTLDSIKNQTYKDFELVFVDDGCSAETVSYILKYKEYFHITYIKNEMNLGLAKSLNRGVSKAEGDYIARLDDDDIIMERRLEKQLLFMENNPDYDACWSDFLYIDQFDNVIGKSKIPTKNILHTLIKKGNCCCHSTFFIKKDVLIKSNGYNEKFLYAQDFELYLRLLNGHKIGCLKEYLVKFRVNTTRNTIEKKILSFVFSFSSAIKYAYYNRTFTIKLLLLIRFLTMFKFVFFDVLHEKDN